MQTEQVGHFYKNRGKLAFAYFGDTVQADTILIPAYKEVEHNLKTINVNIWGAPGSGKTTTAFALTALLKKNGILSEYVREAIKWRIYRGTDQGGELHQDLVLAEQYDDLATLQGQVEVVVNDSPLLMQTIYHNENNSSPALFDRTLELFNEFENYNIVLERNHMYDGRHRYQSEYEADDIHYRILALLDMYQMPYNVVKTSDDVERVIYEHLTDHYQL